MKTDLSKTEDPNGAQPNVPAFNTVQTQAAAPYMWYPASGVFGQPFGTPPQLVGALPTFNTTNAAATAIVPSPWPPMSL